MKDISLQELLEAGCHFGHKKEKWHPKASEFIYDAKEGVHIIDLAKTKEGLVKAADYAYQLGLDGKVLMMVATKRQAKQVVTEAAKKAGAAYLVNRWIGGFLTNWDQVKRNINKLNQMKKDQADGTWKKFVKHEIVKLEKEIRAIEMVYGGVAHLTTTPDALFIVDIKKEDIAVKEAARRKLPVIGVVDTNSDPTGIGHVIPANDDAIGSIQIIVNFIADAYQEGKENREKEMANAKAKAASAKAEKVEKPVEKKAVKVEEKKEEVKVDKTAKKSKNK
jgi:small subunit ribosomal protein S2